MAAHPLTYGEALRGDSRGVPPRQGCRYPRPIPCRSSPLAGPRRGCPVPGAPARPGARCPVTGGHPLTGRVPRHVVVMGHG